MDPRTLRRDEQRQHVVKVAFDLFIGQGYEATTVEAIADTAGISPRTFYRYFEAKDGVLADLGVVIVEEALDRMPPGDEPPSISVLTRTMTVVTEDVMTNRRGDLLFRLLRERPELQERAGRWREQWANQLSDGLAARAGRDEATYEECVISRMAVSIVAVSLDCWVKERARGGSLSDIVEESLTIIHRRLGDVPR